MDISDYRNEYLKDGLRRADLSTSPVTQFEKWFKQAAAAELLDPNAMVLATTDAAGKPSQRIVLLKEFSENGFVFFTNYGSQKSSQIAENNQVSLLFPWIVLERQVEISGVASKISTEASLAYFQSRPHGSQLGAWASQQSTPIDSRAALDKQLESAQQNYTEGEVPLPNWGGFIVKPNTIEFWQGGANRLHDRFEYRRNASQANAWDITRLQP